MPSAWFTERRVLFSILSLAGSDSQIPSALASSTSYLSIRNCYRYFRKFMESLPDSFPAWLRLDDSDNVSPSKHSTSLLLLLSLWIQYRLYFFGFCVIPFDISRLILWLSSIEWCNIYLSWLLLSWLHASLFPSLWSCLRLCAFSKYWCADDLLVDIWRLLICVFKK